MLKTLWVSLVCMDFSMPKVIKGTILISWLNIRFPWPAGLGAFLALRKISKAILSIQTSPTSKKVMVICETCKNYLPRNLLVFGNSTQFETHPMGNFLGGKGREPNRPEICSYCRVRFSSGVRWLFSTPSAPCPKLLISWLITTERFIWCNSYYIRKSWTFNDTESYTNRNLESDPDGNTEKGNAEKPLGKNHRSHFLKPHTHT